MLSRGQDWCTVVADTANLLLPNGLTLLVSTCEALQVAQDEFDMACARAKKVKKDKDTRIPCCEQYEIALVVATYHSDSCCHNYVCCHRYFCYHNYFRCQ